MSAKTPMIAEAPIAHPDLSPSDPRRAARILAGALRQHLARRAGALALVIAVLSPFSPAFVAPAFALTGPGSEAEPGDLPMGKDPSSGPHAPRKAPKDKRSQLEGLFAALKVAPDDRSAKIIGDRLDQLFNTTSSASVDVLMARANAALEAKQTELALKILGQAIEIDPDDIGARSKRATLYYMRDDYGAALADMREVLAREPRHYPMLYGMALILRDIGDDARALDATRKALAVNPRLEGAKELEGQLSLTVEGREI